jgi:hypothetical protein
MIYIRGEPRFSEVACIFAKKEQFKKKYVKKGGREYLSMKLIGQFIKRGMLLQ